MVRQACQRHLRDLARQRTTAFPYEFVASAAQHVLDFFPRFLTLEDGRPFVLPPWLQFCFGSVYGWKCYGGPRVNRPLPDEWFGDDRHGLRRFQHAYLETSKGSGKTPAAGGLGLYGLAYDDEPYAEIYSTGFDEGQAALILKHAIRMVLTSPDEDFKAEFIVDTYNIAHPASGSFFRAMSSQHRSKSGPRPHYVLSDEIHEQRDGTVVGKAEAGFKNRRQPLGLKLTNSGSSRESYCWELHEKSRAILDGSLVDDGWFAYVCQLDPCQPCYDDGYRQPKDGCKDCDHWLNPTVWLKVAPALGIVIQPKYLQDAIDTARSISSEYNRRRRLNFCIWTETRDVWISADLWDSCKVASVRSSNPGGRPGAGGLDLSSTHDLSALVIAVRFDEPEEAPADEIAIEGRDEAGNEATLKYTLNFRVELIPFFWLPKGTLRERVEKERIRYDVWERLGHLFATPGPVIDHQAIYAHVLKVWPVFKVQRLGIDPANATMMHTKLRDDGRLGDRVVSIGQAKKLSEAFKLTEALVRTKRLMHDGQPVLGFCFANAEPKRDRLQALWLEKSSDALVIDGAVATAMAIQQLMILPARRSKGPSLHFIGGTRA